MANIATTTTHTHNNRRRPIMTIENPEFWKPNATQQSNAKFTFGLPASNENKDTFGEVISKEEALAILKSRPVHFMTLEYIRKSNVKEVRVYAKPWQTAEDQKLYFFTE
jgi:hypothetical protein